MYRSNFLSSVSESFFMFSKNVKWCIKKANCETLQKVLCLLSSLGASLPFSWTLMVTLCTTLQTDSYSQSISHFIQLTQTGFSYELWSVNWNNLFSFLGSVSVIYLDCSEMNLAGKEPEHLQKCYLTWRRKNRILLKK